MTGRLFLLILKMGIIPAETSQKIKVARIRCRINGDRQKLLITMISIKRNTIIQKLIRKMLLPEKNRYFSNNCNTASSIKLQI